MKKITVFIFALLLIGASGCANDQQVTEEEAKQIVQEQHERGAGSVEIKSIFRKENKYMIEWEIQPIENGIDSVHVKTGEIKVIESSHGTCKWL